VIVQPPVANRIKFVLGMLSAIDLNNHAMFTAREVNDVWSDGFLSDEFRSIQRS